MTASSWYDNIRKELERFCRFPAGHPTDEEVEQIVLDVVTHENSTGKAAYQSDVEQSAKSRIPGTRFLRTDGLTFQDINALLAMIRARSQSSRK
jgi:hypothetical protein